MSKSNIIIPSTKKPKLPEITSSSPNRQTKDYEFNSSLASSDEGQSNQLRYMSHLQNNTSEQTTQRNIFWAIIFKAITYVRKQEYRGQVDDQMMVEILKQYFDIGQINPKPKQNRIACNLMKNGYFLVMYCILMGRFHHSVTTFMFLMAQFQRECHIKYNKYEFKLFVAKNKNQLIAYETLGIKFEQISSTQQTKKTIKRNTLQIPKSIFDQASSLSHQTSISSVFYSNQDAESQLFIKSH